MTRFQRDMKAALEGDGRRVLAERKAEINRLTREGRSCKNKFQQRCIAQEVARLNAEYEAIDSRF